MVPWRARAYLWLGLEPVRTVSTDSTDSQYVRRSNPKALFLTVSCARDASRLSCTCPSPCPIRTALFVRSRCKSSFALVLLPSFPFRILFWYTLRFVVLPSYAFRFLFRSAFSSVLLAMESDLITVGSRCLVGYDLPLMSSLGASHTLTLPARSRFPRMPSLVYWVFKG